MELIEKAFEDTLVVVRRSGPAELEMAVHRGGETARVRTVGHHPADVSPVRLAVRDQLEGRIAIIVDGGTSPRDVASTIIDLTDEEARWKVMRVGAISAQEISSFFVQEG